jgi:hypothetical protein
MWVILVPEAERKTPMLARAGNSLYLLAFKTGFSARKFVTDASAPAGAEPRMVVGSNLGDIMSSMEGKDIGGVVVDYDFGTNTYKDAGLLY